MAALLFVCVFFVVWDIHLPYQYAFANSIACPLACSCLGEMVDCSKQGLIEVPSDVPSWVEFLDLKDNAITIVKPTAFQDLPNLKLLDLSNNDIEFINDTVFEDLQHLQTLKINHNKLTELPVFPINSSLLNLYMNHNRIITIKPEAMQSLSSLKVMDLNYNEIMDIPLGTFPSKSNLHQLFMNNNRIISLEKGCLDNLTSLEWLKLNKNKIMELNKRVFSNLTNLKTLELMRNKIEVIEGLTFKGLANLQVLKLKRNSIATLLDGAFWGLDNIQNLQLDHNKITNVTKSWLYGLDSLKILTLSNNRIQPLESESWDFCKGLHKLDLTHNKISSIAEKSFAKLHDLQNLYLDHNMVSRIDDGAFRDLTSLDLLEINHNLLSWTIEDVSGVFLGLENLNELSLKNNQIKTIVGKAFHGLKKLRLLHLEDNAITSVQDNAFLPLTDLQELYFNSSNLLCDCQLAWFPQWLSQAGFRNSINGVCAHPTKLKGKSVFEIAVDEFRCNDKEFPKPVIIEHPKGKIALKSDNITLSCIATITGNKKPHFTWKKDNNLLTNVNVVTTATSDGTVITYTTKLHLFNVQDNASGKYQCVISSEFGSAYSERANISVHVFPVFSKTPKDVTVKAGRYAKLECSAKGQPKPEIAWQKDGGNDFPAARERRMRVIPNDDTFFILNVKSIDEGIYSCTAKNVAGTIVANVSVTVLETPSFIRKMEDKKYTKEGETTVLECMASGSPKPKLTWLKDNKALDISERHFFTADNQLLIIVETQKSDAGRYTCEMSNTLGTQRGNSQLTVTSEGGVDERKFPDDASTTTGIIIIAVVCCVVGTSLVWVIIIYQTRKRPELYSATPTDETTLPAELPSSGYASSEKDVSYTPIPIHPYHNYRDYQLKEGNFDRLRTDCGRTTAIFPSDVDNTVDHCLHLSLNKGSAENSLASANYPNSETDTISSTHSSPCVQTFHPIISNNCNNLVLNDVHDDHLLPEDNSKCPHCINNKLIGGAIPKSTSTSSIHSVHSGVLSRGDTLDNCYKHNHLKKKKHPPDMGCDCNQPNGYCGLTSPSKTCDQIIPPSYSDCVHMCTCSFNNSNHPKQTVANNCILQSHNNIRSSSHNDSDNNTSLYHLNIPLPTGSPRLGQQNNSHS